MLRPMEKGEPNSSESKNCKNCGTQVLSNARFCKKCGKSEFIGSQNTITPMKTGEPNSSESKFLFSFTSKRVINSFSSR